MDHAAQANALIIKKVLAWSLWAVNALVIIAFWWTGTGHTFFAEAATLGERLLVVGRLFGLSATFCLLTQFMLMGRVGWLEPIFGLDRLAVFHRRNGVAALLLLLTHTTLIVTGYALLSDNNVIAQAVEMIGGSALIALAFLAELLIVMTVTLSIYIVRKHLKFETWYAVHLFNYVAIASVLWHQFWYGTDFMINPWMRTYWICVYVLALGSLLVWRVIIPIVRYKQFKFTVEKVVAQTSTANSVYITGKDFARFTARGGQFVLVRFLRHDLWQQEHPFSLSMVPDGRHLRLTIRALGDFTTMMPTLKPGTKVMVSGPYGAFTHEKQRTNKVLYIAGGIGITPINAMIQERATWENPEDAVMLYGNRSVADTIFLDDLQKLAAKIHMPLYNVLSDQKDYKGETGFVDIDKIKRLVPDFRERDVYVCGPPPMMYGIIDALKRNGMPAELIHYERFALHKG